MLRRASPTPLVLLVANGHYWANIWTHSLFAAEQTGCFGLGLAIFGYGLFATWFIDRRPRPAGCRRPSGLRRLAGVRGIKENFLPLIPLNIALVVIGNRMIARRTLAGALVLVGLQCAIAFGILHANLTQLSSAGPGAGLAAHLAAIFHTKRYAARILLAWGGGLAASPCLDPF